ncbi:MAG: hypothetical protein GXO32_00655 [Crenarchaeota archaeon]|nr:hypothetical protein [Thermoproteota archaeon]
MKVKGSEPIAIATTRVGREKALAKELENALLLEVEELKVVPMERMGLVIVFGRCASGIEVHKIARARGVAQAFWIIPVDVCTVARYEDVRRASLELVLVKARGLPIKLLCKCRKRGMNIDSCSRLCRFVGELLESLGVVEIDFKGFEYVLRIEIVKECAYLSLYRRNEEQTFRLSTLSCDL